MTAARYDLVGERYAPSEDDLTRPVTLALLELADALHGQTVLDLACGDGLISRELARRGLAVTGLDLSDALLTRARELEDASPLGVDYIHADAATADLADSSFDLVVCHFGLSDIDDLEHTTDNVARWLRRGGSFVFSILHPCFAGGDGADPSWPPSLTYHEEGWWRASGEASTLRQEVGGTHRKLSTYVNALVASGLTVDAMSEPQVEQVWTDSRPTSAGQPVYLVMRCRRPRI